MNLGNYGLALAGILLAGAVPAHAAAAFAQENKMLTAASHFIGTLTEEQKAKALLPFASEERFNWYYIPKERAGLTFKAMTEPQREAALALLKTGLSVKGYQKAATIRQLENVLRELEAGKGPVRDPEMYYITVFGTPAAKGIWGWRYEGHHTSLHWTFIDGKVIASTPQFMGSNPAEVRTAGPMKGTRVLGTEEDLGRALLKSLNAEQRKEALLSDKAPADVLTNNQRQAAIQEDKGVAFHSLNSEQQGMLMAVIREVADAQSPDLAKARLSRLTKAGLESIKFAWMGGPERGDPHYYRIQGKTFLIEYDNTQNEANHVHLVWRDFNGDFGRDLLEEHYKNSPHHAKGN